MTRDLLEQDTSQRPQRSWDHADPSPFDGPSAWGRPAAFRGGVEELWVLAIFCLPTVIDVVLLPVTGVHDLCVD